MPKNTPKDTHKTDSETTLFTGPTGNKKFIFGRIIFQIFSEKSDSAEKENFQVEKLPFLNPKSAIKAGGYPLTK